MGAVSELAPWGAALFSGGAAISAWANRRRTRAEAIKFNAEAAKLGAETHKVEAEAEATRHSTRQAEAQEVIDMYRAEMARLVARVTHLETQTERCEADRRADRAVIEQLRRELAAVRSDLADTQKHTKAAQGDHR